MFVAPKRVLYSRLLKYEQKEKSEKITLSHLKPLCIGRHNAPVNVLAQRGSAGMPRGY
jgi:hypothetical protein